MADSDKALTIQIILDLIGQGKTEEARQKLEALKTTSADLSQQMGVVTVSGAEVEKILGKGGEKAELTHLAMRRLAHAMGSEIPGGAELMESGFEVAENGMMSATFLLIAGIEMLKNAIEHLNKEKADAAKISNALADADAKHTEVIDRQREALEQADVAEAEYLHNLTRNTIDAIARSSELADKLIKARLAASEGEDNTRKGIAGQQIDEMERRSVISHATALQMKEQLDIQYEQQKLLRMKAQDQVEFNETQRQEANREIEGHKLAGNESAAEAKFKDAANAKAANDQKIKEAQDRINAGEDTKKALREKGVDDESVQRLLEFTRQNGGDDNASLQEQYTAAAHQNLKNIAMVGPLVAKAMAAGKIVSQFGEYGDQNLATYQGAQIDINGGKQLLNQYRGRQTDLDINEGNARSDLEAARQAVEKNRAEVQALQDKLTTMTATNAIKEGGAQADLGMDKASNALKGDRATADTLAAGGQVNGVDAKKLIADASQIAGHQVDLQTAAQIIENGANNMGMFMNQVSLLASAMSKLDPQAIAQLHEKVQTIQAQLGAGSEYFGQ